MPKRVPKTAKPDKAIGKGKAEPGEFAAYSKPGAENMEWMRCSKSFRMKRIWLSKKIIAKNDFLLSAQLRGMTFACS